MLFSTYLASQNLLIQDSARVEIGPGATIITSGDFLNNGTLEADGSITAGGETQNNGRIDINPEGILVLDDNTINDGQIFNSGNVSIGGNWENRSFFNTVDGTIMFTGGDDQQFINESTVLKELVVDAGTEVTLQGGRIEVDELIDFNNGVLTTATGATLVVDNDANVELSPNGASYFEGTLILEFGDENGQGGNPVRSFPVGSNGRYGPLEMMDIESPTDNLVEVGVTYITPNSTVPIPDSDIIGVSDESLWRVEVLSGSVDDLDSATVFIDFFDEDLTNFQESNSINADIYSPVVVEADAPGGIFESLGVSDLTNTDSISFGRIESEEKLAFDQNTKYVAIALAPIEPDVVDIFIPEAFAPTASDPRNQAFRVFGSGVVEDDFRMVVLNRYNQIVYETNSFLEAKEVGWDGGDEPGGLYFYVVELLRTDQGAQKETRKGTFYLIR